MEVRPPDPRHHRPAIRDLFARTFGDYWDWVDYGANGYFSGAPYDWGASRIVITDDAVTAHFGVWDFTMRIGSSAVRVAGIGAVATERAHRTRGLMTQTARSAVDGFRNIGYDMSLLFGIRKYYLQFGYVGTFPERIVRVRTRDLRPLDPPVRFTPFNGSVADLATLYNEENAGVTGTFVRPTFTTNARPRIRTVYTFDDGYLVAGPYEGSFQVVDAAGPPHRILDVVRQLASDGIYPEIALVFVPPRSRLGEYLQTITHTATLRSVPDGGPMIKIVNLTSTMEKVAGELSRRLSASVLADYSGRLTLNGDGESVVLIINSGSVVRVEPLAAEGSSTEPAAREPAVPLTGRGAVAGGPALARLIIGDDDPWRVCRQSGIEVSGDARHLLPVLFPNEEPSTVLWDRF